MLNNIIKKVLRESTSTKGSRGSFNPPFRPGLRKWFKNSMYPYNQELSEYVNAENHYDSLDGKMSKNNKNTFSKESKSKKIRNKDWNTEKKKNKINEWVEITSETDVNELINESNSTVTAGLYNGPMELGMKKWKGSLAPFNIEVKHSHNEKAKNTKLKNNVNKVVGVWEKNPDGSYNIPTYDADGIKQKPINEDLAVWFGTKKKPKGSKQPKGPWVNICRKKEGGGHPPCGRPEAKSKGYPKCRAAGVAAKMSDSQKRAACAQKRRAEKTNPKLGTGNKPKMVSYKPKKKLKESNLDSLIKKVLRNY